jgi:hypothetical protein
VQLTPPPPNPHSTMIKIANCFKLHANPQVLPGLHHEQEEKYDKTVPKKAFITRLCFANFSNPSFAVASTTVLQPSAIFGNRRNRFQTSHPSFSTMFCNLRPLFFSFFSMNSEVWWQDATLFVSLFQLFHCCF